jgi:ribosomal protein S3
MLKSLSLFTKNYCAIKTVFKCINKKLDISQSETRFFKEKVMLLQKYKNSLFFKEGINLLFTAIYYKNSANLITKFITSQIKKLKKHNFFLSFLKKTLKFFIKSKISKIKGITILVKGRLNGSLRARHKRFKIGNIPIQTMNSKVDYAQNTCSNSNGSLGIKVWVFDK